MIVRRPFWQAKGRAGRSRRISGRLGAIIDNGEHAGRFAAPVPASILHHLP